MKNIMVLNLGSTSFKFKLFDMDGGEKMLAVGSVDAIGSEKSRVKAQCAGSQTAFETFCPDHDCAFHLCMDALREAGVLTGMNELSAVGYKAVLAGEVSGAQPVTRELIGRMQALVPLAPAHNPVYIDMMSRIMESEPELTQYACFETGFHATIPLKRAAYGVPKAWREWGVRRYGFHGASHSYIASKVSELYPDARRVVSVHLGGSCSMCAILDGKSVASTMGATPQSGLFHNNRVGDFDPFCLPLLEQYLGDAKAVLGALSKESGLLGLSGVSNDLRKVEAAAAQGNEDAQLAIDAFCDAITGYIGMDSAFMGGLDAIVFTGGIGENSALVRAKALEPLGYLGVALDEAANRDGRQLISAADSRVRVLVLETNEEIMIARQVAACV